MVLLHGFTDTWRSWELVLPMLEEHHDVLVPTLAGHAGGPRLGGEGNADALIDAIERAMDTAGFETAHIVGNSLGGYIALRLAERARARAVVALAPAGGWMQLDRSREEVLDLFRTMQQLLKPVAPYAEAMVASREGRRAATRYTAVKFEHIPPELLAHQIRGAAGCEAAYALIEHALRHNWVVAPERITCPVRIIWGTADRMLPWPNAATRYRVEWLPHADWIELEGVGHCPQLDVPLETAQLILGFTA
ncbi:MAG TPA: alpha/beta hydrolase [Solirubrobacteraceae bacterium]